MYLRVHVSVGSSINVYGTAAVCVDASEIQNVHADVSENQNVRADVSENQNLHADVSMNI